MGAALNLTHHPPGRAHSDLREAVDLTTSLVSTGSLPCAVLGVSDARGTLTMHAVPGPTDGRVAADSVFFLASLTKPLATATSLMLLVADGRIDLDDPVAKVLPAFGERGKESVTIRHLLTHTSGLKPWRPFHEALLEPEPNKG